MRRWAIAGAVALSGCGALLALRLGSLLAPEQVATVTVERGDFLREVTAEGALEAVEATPIVVPGQSPQTIAFVVPDGTPVELGDVVVRFDPYQAERAAADGRDDLEAARSKLTRVDAEGESARAGDALDVRVAREQLARAREIAPEERAIFARNELIEARIDRTHYAKRSDAAGRKLSVNEELTTAKRRVAQVEEDRSELTLRHAQDGLGSLRVEAPHSGLVILTRNWQGDVSAVVGANVWPRQKLAEIPDLERLRARVHVLEADAAGLEPGLAARVFLEGRPGSGCAAEVETVEPIAKPRDRRSPVKYFEVVLSLPETDLELMRPGGRIKAVIELEREENVINVPRAAVFEVEGERFAYRAVGGSFERVPVRVGRHSLSRVVILEGLAPGDSVALRDPGRDSRTSRAPPEGDAS